MKEPWTVYIPCCCCCRPKRPETNQPKLDLERGNTSLSSTTSNDLNDEVSPAQRAIDLALRHSMELEAGNTRQEEASPAPPSYDSVLKDDDRRNPRSGRPAELHGISAPPRFPPAVATGKGGYHSQQQQQQQQQRSQPQESVFSDEDDDVVLTPPTTAPPTIVDEDSDDDERLNGPFRDR